MGCRKHAKAESAREWVNPSDVGPDCAAQSPLGFAVSGAALTKGRLVGRGGEEDGETIAGRLSTEERAPVMYFGDLWGEKA